jgi:hypothetical protein
LRGDQRAMPDPKSAEFQQAVAGSALPGSTVMGQSGWASVEAGSGEDSAAVTDGASADLSGVDGLREQKLSTLRQHGIDPDSGQTVDASQVPGLQHAVFRLLAESGVDVTGLGRPAAEDDPDRPSDPSG